MSIFLPSIVLLKIALMDEPDMEGLIARTERLLNRITGKQLTRFDYKAFKQLTLTPRYEHIIKRLMFKQLLFEYQVFISK